MSIRQKLGNFILRKAFSQASVLSTFGLTMGHTGAETPEQLIAKIRGWSWTCINRNAQACAQVPLRLYKVKGSSVGSKVKLRDITKKRQDFLHTKLAERVNIGDELEEITDHPILDLLRDVNPQNNSFDLKDITVRYLEAIGVDYWWTERGAGNKIINIWPLMSQYVTIVFNDDNTKIERYEYKPGTVTKEIPPEDMVHFKYASLTSMLYGDSPTKAGEQSIDLNESMNQFEISSFKNGGTPSMVLEVPTDGNLSPEERKRIMADYRTNTAGTKNTGNLLIGSGGAKVHEYGHSPKDMNFMGGRKTTLEETCGVYGVPLSFVVPTEISRDNLRSSLTLWMQFTINPKLIMIEQKLNEQFTRNWGEGLFLLFDDPVPVDSEARLKQMEVQLRTKYSFVNEQRAIDGLDPVEWGDEPVEAEKPANEQQEEPKPEPKKEAEIITKKEGPTNDLPEPDLMPAIFLANMVTMYKAMETEILKNLRNYGKAIKAIEGEEAAGAAFAGSVADIVSSVYDEAKWANIIAIETGPFIRGMMTNGLVDAAEKVAPDAVINASSPRVMEALRERAGQIRTVANTVETELRKDITESIAAGESKGQTIKRVRENFDTRAKAERLVRTETIWAHNEGTVIAWKDSNVVSMVKWDTVPDDRRCPYCKSMHGKTKTLSGNFFDKGESLTVKGDAGNDITLKFRYEPIVHPPLHPNCRCQLIPIIAE